MPYTWYGGGPRPRRHCVKSGPSSAHVYCGQTAGWIKMPIGTKVALDPGHIVLDVDPSSSLGTTDMSLKLGDSPREKPGVRL